MSTSTTRWTSWSACGPSPRRSEIGLQLALAWNHHQPGVTSAIAGSRDAGHTRENAAAGDIALDADSLAALDAAIAA